MRKNIFEILEEKNDLETEVMRITSIFEDEEILNCEYGNYNLIEFVDEYCLEEWNGRGHCIDVDDYLRSLNYSLICEKAKIYEEDFITLIEIIYNLWELVDDCLENLYVDFYRQGNYMHLKTLLDDGLAKYNYKMYSIGNGKYIAIEDKPEVTAVVEIIKPELGSEIIRYNHYSLKGEIELKKSILLSMSDELEPQRDNLSQINSKLEDGIFFILNNLNLRHNNKSGKNCKGFVANMHNEELEDWYDELYQMMLLAFLLLDNQERNQKIQELKVNMNSK